MGDGRAAGAAVERPRAPASPSRVGVVRFFAVLGEVQTAHLVVGARPVRRARVVADQVIGKSPVRRVKPHRFPSRFGLAEQSQRFQRVALSGHDRSKACLDPPVRRIDRLGTAQESQRCVEIGVG